MARIGIATRNQLLEGSRRAALFEIEVKQWERERVLTKLEMCK